jgi:hypothetical protein
VNETPFGRQELEVLVVGLDEYRNLSIHCLNTGTFVRFELTGAREGTFVDSEIGMDPKNISSRVIDAVAGRRYFAKWIDQTFVALERAAKQPVGT